MPTKDTGFPSHPRAPYEFPGKIPETIIESITYLVLRPPTNRSAIHISAPTYTTDVKLLDLNVTWNNAGVTFTGLKLAITDTASAVASKALDVLVGGTSILSLRKDGSFITPLKVAGIAANTTNFSISGASLTGTSVGPLIDWAATLNTSGLARAFRLNITNTASGIGSPVFDVQLSGVSFLRIDTTAAGASGSVIASGTSFVVQRAGTTIAFFTVNTAGSGTMTVHVPTMATATATFLITRASGGNLVSWDANGDATFFRHITGSTLTGTALIGGSLSASTGLFSGLITGNVGAVLGTAAGGDVALILRADNEFLRYIRWQTGTDLRWVAGAGSDDETGSDAGSQFGLWAYDDAGLQIDAVMLAQRAAGTPVLFGRSVETAAVITDELALHSAGFLTFTNPGSWLFFSDQLWLRGSNGEEIHYNSLADALFIYSSATQAKLYLGLTDSLYRADTHSFDEADGDPIVSLTSTLLAPANTNTVSLGNSGLRWSSVNGVLGNFSGALTAQTTLAVQGTSINLGSNAGGSATLFVNAAAATSRQIEFQSAGVGRWTLRIDNTAESGSDAGSSLLLIARNDAGTAIDNVIIITRAAGGSITVSRRLVTVASASARAGFNLPHGAAPSSPVNGDMWSDTSGAYIRINGTTKTFTLT